MTESISPEWAAFMRKQMDLAYALTAEHARATDTLAAGAASVRSARRVRAVTIRCETRIGHVHAEIVVDATHGVSVLSVVTDDGDAWSLPEIAVQLDATRDVAKFVARLRQGIVLGADAHEYPTPIPATADFGDGTNNDSLDADHLDLSTPFDAQEQG